MKPEVLNGSKVFRDADELTSGVLSDEPNVNWTIRYLIVICSSNSATIKYHVGEEIAYFRSKGRERDCHLYH